jgi:hypothetical protein
MFLPEPSPCVTPGRNYRKKAINEGIVKRFSWIMFLVFFCTVPALSMAEMTGKELLQKCEPVEKLDEDPASLTSREATGVVYCLGYIESFMDTFSFQRDARIVPAVPYCLPKEQIPKKKFARIVVNYMKDNADQLDKPASYAIFMGIRGAYPCKAQNESDGAKAATPPPLEVEIQSGPPVSTQPDSK